MKHTHIFRLLLLGGYMLWAPFAHGEIVDAVAATVDAEVILYSEIMEAVTPELETIRMEAAHEEEFEQKVDVLARQALQEAIDGKILLREALLAGIEVTDEQVDERLADIRELYPSNEAFLQELEQAGETVTDLRARIRKQIQARTMAVVKRRQFEKEAVVTESAVAQYYQDHKAEFNRPERVRCRQICLFVTDRESRARAHVRLEELKKEIEAGASFEALAVAHSEAPGAEDGGIVGWVVRGDLVPALEEVVFALPENGVSEIVDTANAVHLLKVDEREAPGQASLDEKRTDIERILREQAADERYRSWMGELRKRSRVRIFL